MPFECLLLGTKRFVAACCCSHAELLFSPLFFFYKWLHHSKAAGWRWSRFEWFLHYGDLCQEAQQRVIFLSLLYSEVLFYFRGWLKLQHQYFGTQSISTSFILQRSGGFALLKNGPIRLHTQLVVCLTAGVEDCNKTKTQGYWLSLNMACQMPQSTFIYVCLQITVASLLYTPNVSSCLIST